MQETIELFAEFQISFKILEKLPERNSELMGMIKHITLYTQIYRRIY